MENRRVQDVGDERVQAFVMCARSVGTIAALVDAAMACTPSIVAASVCGVFLRMPTGLRIQQNGAPEAWVTQYGAFTTVSVDPIYSALSTRHGVVRSNDLFDDEAWRRHPFYRDLAAPFGLDAYMAGELVDARATRGAISVARSHGSAAFSLSDVQRLQAICLHASVAFTRLSQGVSTILPASSLSPRQQEMVQLVANGLTNDQIGLACGITTHAVKKALERLFARVHVSSRVELIAKLGVRTSEP